MNLSFNISKDQSSISSSRRNLAPFTVHAVTFAGAEIVEGVSKAGNEYKLMTLTFENKEGSAKMSIFFPKDGDGARPTRKSNKDGHEYEVPSFWDNNWSIMKQTLEVLSPKGYEKYAEIVPKLPGKTPEDKIANLFKYYVEIINKVKGAETNIKLSGYTNQQGYMQLTFPTICAINKEGDCFITDNYIGDNVALSPYEDKKRKELAEAKPTEIKEADAPASEPESTEDPADEYDLANL